MVEQKQLPGGNKPFYRRLVGHPAVWSGLILILLLPYPTTIVPEWRVRVVDETGKPFAGVVVRQSWHHYSYDVHDGDKRVADEDGYVRFPERTFSAPILYRLARTAVAVLFIIAHGSIGTHAGVWACVPGSEGVCEFVDYMPGKPPAKEIVLRD